MILLIVWMVIALLLVRIYFDKEKGLTDIMFFKALLWPLYLCIYIVNKFCGKANKDVSDSQSK